MTTNYEKVINMSLDDLAEFIRARTMCSFCVLRLTPKINCNTVTCKEAIKQWLQLESKV